MRAKMAVMLHHSVEEAYTPLATGAEPGDPSNRGPADIAAPRQQSSSDPAVLEAAQAGEQGSDWEAPALASQGPAELPLNDTGSVTGASQAQTADVAEWSDSVRLAISTRFLLAALSAAQPGICYTQVPSWQVPDHATIRCSRRRCSAQGLRRDLER